MKKYSITNTACRRHLWLPICYYHLSDGSNWVRYRCSQCGETYEQQMTSSENDQNGSKEMDVNQNAS